MVSASVLDLQAAAIVVGGTLLASVLRCGWYAAGSAVKAVAGLVTKGFNQDAVRQELAVQIQAIAQDGLLRAEPRVRADSAFDAAAATLIRSRSIQALYEEHRQHRLHRQQATQRAVAVLSSMGELAPVLGLVGTLVALSSLSAGGMVITDYGRAIGMAVTTTLYGLLLANFVANPLCARVQRRADAEEAAREELLRWLADSVRQAAPKAVGVPAALDEFLQGAA